MKNVKSENLKEAEVIVTTKPFIKEVQTTGIIPNFRNHYNAAEPIYHGERNILPSLAVPDMSLSIQEIIKRHTRGLPIFGTEMGYDETYDPLGGRDINSLDIEEVWQIANEARERYSTAQDKYIAEQKLKREQDIRQQGIEEYKKILEKAQSIEPKVLGKTPTNDQ